MSQQPATSFETARDELATVVSRLEAGGLSLEESLALWQRGEELAGLCQEWLDRAREQVQQATAQQPD
jgi:exodeoxyribonuclease VII small subunit